MTLFKQDCEGQGIRLEMRGDSEMKLRNLGKRLGRLGNEVGEPGDETGKT